ncbi:transposase [Streptacidiphilus sp. MAP12-33]|uniref:TniQ family protein n=1 Tax=Streptacidiphilus sp. MAP12-33 TaxID=3156266 RepID=UPI003514C678
MMNWSGGELPIFLAPQPGEALDSWLEAYARRLRTTTHSLTSFVGLLGSRPGAMTHRLTDHERLALQRATGLPDSALVSMTLEPFNGLTVAFDKNRPGALRRPPHWRAFGAFPRFCPNCLRESQGRWPLVWRQPWVFACPRHHCMLLEQCPACERPVRASGTRTGGPSRPASCTRGTHRQHGERRSRVTCGYPLDQANATPLPADGVIIAAQHHVDHVLEQISTDPGAASQHLADLYALGSRGLAAFDIDPAGAPEPALRILAEVGGALPAQTNSLDATDVRSIAIGTAIAIQALPDPEPREQELLDWAVACNHRRSAEDGQNEALRNINQIAAGWSKSSPHLAGTALRSLDASISFIARLRYGTSAPTPYWRRLSKDEVEQRASSVPAQLWPSWALRLLPSGPGAGLNAELLRAATCPLLLIPGTAVDYKSAIRMLTDPGLGRRSPKQLKLPANIDPGQISAILTQLAWALDQFGSPIDYARRRRIFQPGSIHIDKAAFIGFCTDHGLRSPSPRRESLLTWIVWSLLLGSDAPTPEHRSPRHHSRHLSPFLKEFASQQAEAHLRDAGIDEPVRWEPPAHWVTGITWPGVDPASIPTDHVNKLATQAPRERELAVQLGLTRDQLDLYCEIHDIDFPKRAPMPLPRPPREPRSDRGIRRPQIHRTGDLSRDRLRQLYLDGGETLDQIAARANCSKSTVRRALQDFEIPMRTRRRPGTLERTISRAWLEDEYTRKGRSTPDIAREMGLTKNNIMRLLRRWDIPRRHQVHSNVFAALPVELSPAMARLSQTRNILPRLRNLTALPGHQTLQAAANALGIRRGALDYQLQHVEATAGITLINRSRPLSATGSGQLLIAEARQLLGLLDEHTQSPAAATHTADCP